MRLTRLYLWATIVTAALLALTYGGMIVLRLSSAGGRPVGDDAFIQVALWMLGAFLYSGAGLLCAIPMERGRHPRAMRSALVLGAVATVGWCITPYLNWFDEPFNWPRALVWPSVWACCMIILGLLSLIRARATWWRLLRRACLAIVFLLGGVICLGVTFAPMYVYGRLPATAMQGAMLVVGSYAFGVFMLILALGAYLVLPPSKSGGRRSTFLLVVVLSGIGLTSIVLAASELDIAQEGISTYTYDIIPLIPGLDRRRYDEILGKSIAILTLLSIAALCVTLISALFQPPGHRTESDTALAWDEPGKPFWLVCPRCESEQTATTGQYRCTECGLRVYVEIVP